MDNPSITGLSLCSGVGMLDEAVGLVLGGHHVACYCEWESGAASVLMARMEEQSLVAAPIFCGDLGGFDARLFLGVVDILTAGLPCQPYSPAGKQIGNTDARSHGEDGKSGPIPHFLRIVGECRPSMVFLENVPAWVRGGHFRPVGEELCRMGYALADPVFLAAGDVGAAHERERVFVMAYLADGTGERCAREWLDARAQREGGADADGRGAELADASGKQDDGERRDRDGIGRGMDGRGKAAQREHGETNHDCAGGCGVELATLGHAGHDAGCAERRSESRGRRTTGPEHGAMPWGLGGESDGEDAVGRGEQQAGGTRSGRAGFAGASGDMADAASGGEGAMHGAEPGHIGAAEHGECGGVFCPPIFAPAPNFAGWGGLLAAAPHLAPATQPGVCVVADGVAVALDEARDVQLRCGGNGVVALCGAGAFEHLLRTVAGEEKL